MKLGFVQELEITKVLARQYRMPAVDLSNFQVDSKIIRLIPAEMAVKNVVLPLKREGRTLTVAMADPTDIGLLEDLKFITRYDLFPVIAGEFTLRTLIEKHYDTAAAEQQQLSNMLRDMEEMDDTDVEVLEEHEDDAATQAQIDDAPVVKLINAILTDALKKGRDRHPLRVLREGAPRPLPHRRRAPGDHEAADQDAAGADLALQDHGEPQHRRAPRAAGRPHQAEDRQPRSSTSVSRPCRRCSAKRSCSVFSTRAT